eukprot:748509-Hanusia_phi.AAC.4
MEGEGVALGWRLARRGESRALASALSTDVGHDRATCGMSALDSGGGACGVLTGPGKPALWIYLFI